MTVRDTNHDDLPAIDRLRQAVEPWHVASVATQRLRFDRSPAGARERRLSLLVDDDLVAAGIAGLDPYSSTEGAALCTSARRVPSTSPARRAPSA